MATMLALSLCCVSCATAPRSAVSAGGNAILAELPPGTVLQLPSKEAAVSLQRVLANEAEPVAPILHLPDQVTWLRLTQPLKVCTPSYLAERDAAELELHRIIQASRLKAP